MIIALLALAFAMIVGGLLSAFFGWDIVLIERGWTMVIAGSFSAACGALLLGITAAVSKLARIQTELARLHNGFDGRARDSLPVSPAGLPVAALAGGALAGHMVDRPEAEKQDDTQPDLPFFTPGDTPKRVIVSDAQPAPEKHDEPVPPKPSAGAPADMDDDTGPEVRIPDFLIAERREETGVAFRGNPVGTSLFAAEPKLPEPENDDRRDPERDGPGEPSAEPESDLALDAEIARELGREPAREAAAAPEDRSEDEKAQEPDELREPHEPRQPHEPHKLRETHEPGEVHELRETPELREPLEPDEGDKADQADQAPRSGSGVIGTYNSGDNTYVMFADGSIEAQTPKGLFRFQSLDELKAFIASGGEEGGSLAT